MNAQEFLELLLPDTGIICTATLKPGGGWSNKQHQSIAAAVADVNWTTFIGLPAYYAMATYEQDKVWDHSANNGEGKFTFRTQANTLYIKSFFLDLDIGQEDDKKFDSKAAALAALDAFVAKVGLPPPMVVDSGGGIHAYWPLAHQVATSEWRPVADKLKAICIHEDFKADRSLTSDQARVLRCLGGFNYRRGAPVQLLRVGGGPYGFHDIEGILDAYGADNGVAPVRNRIVDSGLGAGGSANAAFADEGNIGTTDNPGNFDRVVYHCGQLASQVNVHGAGTGEVLWRSALGVAKFCLEPEKAYRALSEGHSDYSWSGTLAKVEGWHTGPATCASFEAENPSGCQGCPHREKIKSPIVLGRDRSDAPTPMAPIEQVNDLGEAEEIFVAPRPAGYSLKGSKVMYESEDKEGAIDYVEVCPYDLYPIRIMRQSGMDILVEERSMWRAHLPRMGATDMEMPQSMISDHRKLYAYLMQKGVYMTDENAKATQRYMSYYLQSLAEAADRDKLYERLGWHDDHKSYVLGNKVITHEGKMRQVNPSKTVRAVTKDGVVAAGSMQAWKDAMSMYAGPGYEGTRFFIYAALGAPLFHMNDTGNKGVLITASGESGRGKTTALKACASLWGKPDNLIMNGNKEGSTVNALYETLGCYHSLPFLWDDITERDPEEIRRFLLNISQGRGKDRMKGAEHVGKTVTWETIVLASANTDDISRVLASGRDVSPHLMRMIGVPFGLVKNTPEAKLEADNFLRAINQNHGHAGPLMMKFVVQHYEKVQKGYIKNVAMVDKMLNSSNAAAERYWSAAVAAAYTAAQVASSLGLIDYPYQSDLQWMVDHLGSQRESIQDTAADPVDVLVEFLETHIGNTLAVSAKNSSNLDCTVVKPYNALLIRHELDADLIFISRQAVMDFCNEKKMPFRRMEQVLEAQGIITRRSHQKVLGADTVYAKGQTRCWEVDAAKLGIPAPAVPTQPSGSAKVVSITKGKAA